MIGVFDSGVGGLAVLAAIARALPAADLTYVADAAHLPYGSKPDGFVRQRVLAIGDRLAAAGCRLLVVACNTATAAAIEALRARHPGIPVVGVEPGIKPAAASTRTRRIAILATESTCRSARLARLIATHAGALPVSVQPCPGWATRVEALDIGDPAFVAEVRATLVPLVEAGADRIVLGCTHYAFLMPAMLEVTAGRAEIVDVSEAVARRVAQVAGPERAGSAALRLLSTGDPQRLAAALAAFGLDALQRRMDAAPTHLAC